MIKNNILRKSESYNYRDSLSNNESKHYSKAIESMDIKSRTISSLTGEEFNIKNSHYENVNTNHETTNFYTCQEVSESMYESNIVETQQ